MRLTPLVLLAFCAGAAAQTTGGSLAPLPSSPGELRGPGLPAVPNNRLAPLPNPLVSDPGVAPLPRSAATPGESSAATPGFSIPPAAPAAVTPGVVIELPPPAALAPGSPAEVRTCPGGITFC